MVTAKSPSFHQGCNHRGGEFQVKMGSSNRCLTVDQFRIDHSELAPAHPRPLVDAHRLETLIGHDRQRMSDTSVAHRHHPFGQSRAAPAPDNRIHDF